MYSLRGFIQFPQLINNAVGEVSPIGELSKHASTYSRETGFYRYPEHDGVNLISFESTDGDGNLIPVPDHYGNFASKLAKQMLEDAKKGLYIDDVPMTFNRLRHDFNQYIENLQVGRMVTNGDIWLPEWVSFKLRQSDNFIRLWFADDAFRRQYSRYEYAFIAPVENLDDLHGTAEQVLAAVNQKSYLGRMEAIERERNQHPYTHLVARNFPWEAGDVRIPLDWTILVYGQAGADYDLIRVALADWIVENSSYSREEWLPVIPEIFTPTEFILTPLWHQYAIANKTIQAGMYSPLIQYKDVDDILKKTALGVGYELEDRFNNASLMPFPYKSVSMLTIGSAENRNGNTRITHHFPDFINVSHQSTDFGRMHPNTQEWVREITEMIKIAETADSHTLLPLGYHRVKRGDVLYIGRSFDDVMYMVVTRYSLQELLDVELPIFPGDIDEDDDPTSGLDQLLDIHLAQNNPHELRLEDFGLDKEYEGVALLTVHQALDSIRK